MSCDIVVLGCSASYDRYYYYSKVSSVMRNSFYLQDCDASLLNSEEDFYGRYRRVACVEEFFRVLYELHIPKPSENHSSLFEMLLRVRRVLRISRAFVHGRTFLHSWSGPMTLVVGLLHGATFLSNFSLCVFFKTLVVGKGT